MSLEQKIDFSFRPLIPADAEVFAPVRLQALQECAGFFGSTYALEKQFTLDKWCDLLTPDGRCFFGLFSGGELVGITGVITDRTEETQGMMIASYIQPAYRGKGLSDYLYKGRIDWAREHTTWKQLIVSHREDNEASRRANQRHGAVFLRRANKTWPDGVTCDEVIYSIDLRPKRLDF